MRIAVAIAVTTVLVACTEQQVNLGGRTDASADGAEPPAAGCPAFQKVCPDITTRVLGCVDESDPNYGCGASSCESCEVAAAGPGPAPRGIPTQYGCTPGGNCIPNGSTCPPPWQHCDMTHPYCESNRQTDPNNCGSCGNSCPTSAPNATALACVQGLCKVTVCQTAFADCDGDPGNGCEVRLDASNCWSCPPMPGSTACCQPCYVGSAGLSGVCPACAKPNGMCDTSTKQCN